MLCIKMLFDNILIRILTLLMNNFGIQPIKLHDYKYVVLFTIKLVVEFGVCSYLMPNSEYGQYVWEQHIQCHIFAMMSVHI